MTFGAIRRRCLLLGQTGTSQLVREMFLANVDKVFNARPEGEDENGGKEQILSGLLIRFRNLLLFIIST